MIGETRHPLLVTASAGEIRPCSKGDECGKWVSGEVTIYRGRNTVSSTALTGAGCEVCPGPEFDLDDLRTIKSHHPLTAPGEQLVRVEVIRGTAELVQKANQLPVGADSAAGSIQ